MPKFFHVMVARLRAFFRPGDLDRDFDQELGAHLAMAEEDKIRRGMTLEEAKQIIKERDNDPNIHPYMEYRQEEC